MSATLDPRMGILVCLTSLDDDLADQSALRLAKLFGSRCRALLIEDRIETKPKSDPRMDKGLIARRRRRLSILAEEIGINVEIDVSDLSPGVQHLKSQPVKGTTILMQPAHPLSRQTHTYRSIQNAAAEAGAATVYSPPIGAIGDGDILAITSTRSSGSAMVAKDLAKRTGREFEIFIDKEERPSSVTALVRDLSMRMSLDAPALIVMSQNELLTRPSEFSSLAARLDTPILVVTGGLDGGAPGGVG